MTTWSSTGPWIPTVRMVSMSAVREGPVTRATADGSPLRRVEQGQEMCQGSDDSIGSDDGYVDGREYGRKPTLRPGRAQYQGADIGDGVVDLGESHIGVDEGVSHFGTRGFVFVQIDSDNRCAGAGEGRVEA